MRKPEPLAPDPEELNTGQHDCAEPDSTERDVFDVFDEVADERDLYDTEFDH